MDRFQLTVHLAVPMIIGGGYMTLDALLAAPILDALRGIVKGSPLQELLR